MTKTVLRSKLVILVALLIGIALGFYGGVYAYQIYPQQHAAVLAKQEQATMEATVRSGNVVSINAGTVVIKVTSGAADIGKTLILNETSSTTVQVGASVLNKMGEQTDLTKWYKVGDTVDTMTKDDATLVAIYRPLGQGEQVAEAVQQTP
jgi:hypothetical protein